MTSARHAHEVEAAGEPRWKARFTKGLLMVTDLASGEEVQAQAYTDDGDAIRFSLPGENGLRELRVGAPGYEDFKTVLAKSPIDAPSKPATEKKVA